MNHLNLKIRNTTKLSEHSGRWAAVFIPYIEEHDAFHYTKVLAELTLAEVAAMPYAQSSTANRTLNLTYRMRDSSAYCARSREMDESIGVCFFIWDSYDRDDLQPKPASSTFSCEIDASGS